MSISPAAAGADDLIGRIGQLAKQAEHAANGTGDYLNPPTEQGAKVLTTRIVRLQTGIEELAPSIVAATGDPGDMALDAVRKAVADGVATLKNGIAVPTEELQDGPSALLIKESAPSSAGTSFHRAQSILERLAMMTQAASIASSSVEDVGRAAAALQ